MIPLWLETITFICCYELGKWSYTQLKTWHKLRNGTAYKSKILYVEGSREWIEKMRPTFDTLSETKIGEDNED